MTCLKKEERNNNLSFQVRLIIRPLLKGTSEVSAMRKMRRMWSVSFSHIPVAGLQLSVAIAQKI